MSTDYPPPTRAIPMPPPGPPPTAQTVALPVPPRNVSRSTCPKCGGVETGMLHRPALPPCDLGCCGAQAEHFDRWCRNCRWQWRTHDVIGA